MKNHIKVLFASLAMIFVLIGVNLYGADFSNIKQGLLTVAYLNVGQGDSILIRTPSEQNVLIDGGPNDSVISELDKIVPLYDREIDIMVLTHPHADHVDGLVDVLQNYEVEEVYYTGVTHTAPGYIEWLNQIQMQQIPMNIINGPIKIELSDDIALDFLYPLDNEFLGESVENLNDTSIVNKLIYNNTSFLFTGDAEIKEEEQILQSGVDLTADVLKVGHHGSLTATSDEFLQAVNPQYAVIMLGQGNSFGHPHYRTIKKLNDNQIEIYRTDELGTIVVQSDGQNIYFVNE